MGCTLNEISLNLLRDEQKENQNEYYYIMEFGTVNFSLFCFPFYSKGLLLSSVNLKHIFLCRFAFFIYI